MADSRTYRGGFHEKALTRVGSRRPGDDPGFGRRAEDTGRVRAEAFLSVGLDGLGRKLDAIRCAAGRPQ